MHDERRRLIYSLAAWEDSKLEHYGTEQGERAARKVAEIHDRLGEMSDSDFAMLTRAKRFYLLDSR